MAIDLKHLSELASPRESDPLSASLLWLGIAASIISVVVGVALGWEGFASNLAATFAVVGPAFYLTNFIVRRYEQRKLHTTHAPTINTTIMLCAEAAAIADRICARISPDTAVPPRTKQSLLQEAGTRRLCDVVLDELQAADQRLSRMVDETQATAPRGFALTESPVELPPFPLIASLIGHVASSVPLTESYLHATAALHGYSRRAVTVVHYHRDVEGKGIIERIVGGDAIQDAHEGGSPNGWVEIASNDLLRLGYWSLTNSSTIVEQLKTETEGWMSTPTGQQV